VDTYAAHIDHLSRAYGDAIAAAGYDALVIASGRAAAKNRFDDQYWPLSPTPAFTHWLPLPEADAFVVLRPGARPKLVRTVVDDYWDAPKAPARRPNPSDIRTDAPAAPSQVQPESDHFWSAFELVEVRADDVAAQLPSGPRVATITRDALPEGNTNPPALVAALDRIRTRKTAYEVECLYAASARAVPGHRKAAAMFAEGDPSELQLHLAYLAATDQTDASAPYQGIVAVGEHTAILHWVAYHRRPSGRADTSLLVDAGASHLGYGCDITRTYSRGTSPAARRFAELVAAMDRLQLAVCAAIQPGMEYEALHDHAHLLLASALRELGIATGSADELVARGVTRALFPHGLGHSLGVSVHDVGMKPRAPRADNPFLRNTSVIEVGQVFTIEPGCYVIPALVDPLRADDRERLLDWARIDELAAFGGVRIEDDVVVTPGGIDNLTRRAFAAPAGP
jgi:Xaa-Pro dipeptidase